AFFPHVYPRSAHVLALQPLPPSRPMSDPSPMKLVASEVDESLSPPVKLPGPPLFPHEITTSVLVRAITTRQLHRPTSRISIGRNPPTINMQLCALNTGTAMPRTSAQ